MKLIKHLGPKISMEKSHREKHLENRIEQLEGQIGRLKSQLEKARNHNEVLYIVRLPAGSNPRYQHLTVKENALKYLGRGRAVKIYEVDFTNNTFKLIAGTGVKVES